VKRLRGKVLGRLGVRGAFAAVILGTGLFYVPHALARRPAFAVMRVHSYLRRGVYYLDADLSLRLNPRAHRALVHGVALTFIVEIHIIRYRRFLWNEIIGRLRERYRLSYRPLTRTYRVENLNIGSSNAYDSLAGALDSLNHIRRLPLIDASLLARHTRYLARIRVGLDDQALPGPLKLVSLLLPGWQLESTWNQWVLVQ